jgi:hypothetical protein
MKVVYEKSITERIREAKFKSERDNKKIQYIEVTEKEAVEMYDYSMAIFIGHYCPMRGKCLDVHNGMMFGVRIKVEGYDESL